MKKTVLILLLVALLTVMLAIPAAAEGTVEHCLCGANTATDAACESCGQMAIAWEPWTAADSLPTSGNYYLTTDVTVTATSKLNGTNLALDLNGKTITNDSADGKVSVYHLANGNVTITDTSAAQSGKIVARGGNTQDNAGIMRLGAKATLNLYAGTLDATGFSAQYGAAIAIDNGDAVMNMYGGTVKGGTATSMYGGGAICLFGTVNMTGGTIEGGAASSGGDAIRTYSGSVLNVGGNAVIKNGTTADGVAIHVAGTLTVSGSAKIESGVAGGNTKRWNCICGDPNGTGTVCADGGHATVEWMAWYKADSLPTSGNYYLTTDVTTTQTNIDGTQVCLDLNGKTVTLADGATMVFNIKNSGSLTVTDTSAAQSGKIVATGIRGNGDYPGLVNIQANSSFTLHAGTLDASDFSSMYGVAIVVNEATATVNMYGGTIKGGTATSVYGGGAICSFGTVNISGGVIESGNAARGGGGAIRTYAGSTLNMSGDAKILGGTAEQGGAIYSQGAVTASDNVSISGIFNNVGGTYSFSDNVRVKTIISGDITTRRDCVCGDPNGTGTACADDGHPAGEWVALGNSGNMPTTGYYYLTADITGWRGDIVGAENHLYLDLNGHTVTLAGSADFLFNVKNGGSLSIVDTSEAQTGKLVATGTRGNGDYPGIVVVEKATFDLYSGTLEATDFSSQYGVAVVVNDATATMNMYGGTIKGGTATSVYGGGAICSFGTVNISGGVIESGNAARGGGAAIRTYAGSTLNMSGNATILGGTEAEGGAIYSQGTFTAADNVSISGVFNNVGGTYSITGNVRVKSIVSGDTATRRDCVCGDPNGTGTACADGGHAIVEWIGFANSGNMPTTGYYFLTGDITGWRGDIVGAENHLYLDLNGHTVTLAGSADFLFNVKNGGSLSIVDTSEAQTGKLVATGTRGNGDYPGIVVVEKATFDLYSGTLEATDFSSQYGVAVVVNDATATMNMYGGTIKGGTATSVYGGGAICSFGTVNISGGVIESGNAARGGGGAIRTYAGSTLNMSGDAKILGGTADQGGAIYSEGTFNASDNVSIAGVFNNVGGKYSIADSVRIGSIVSDGITTRRSCVCGDPNGTGTPCAAEGHISVEWTGLGGSGNMPTTGYYFLTADINGWRGDVAGEASQLYLDLNGHTVTLAGSADYLFNIKNGGSVTITDTSEAKNGKLVASGIRGKQDMPGIAFLQANATFNLYAGIVDVSGFKTMYGCGFLVNDATAAMNIYGGTIKGGISKSGFGGGAIYNYGTVNISGGTIESGSVIYGGAITSEGIINMTGGTIIGGTVGDCAGAIWIAKGEMNMTGGTIIGGTAGIAGGAIYINGAMTMDGGIIYGGTAGYGGAIVVDGTMIMNGGKIIGGSAIGTKNGVGGAIELTGKGKMTMNGGSIEGGKADRMGGSVYVHGSSSENYGVFTMNGGSISGGSAPGGGTVAIASYAKFYLYDGTISGGTATGGCGGNIYANGGGVDISGGQVYDGATPAESIEYRGGNIYFNGDATVTVGGNAKIYGGQSGWGGNIGYHNYGKLNICGSAEIYGGNANHLYKDETTGRGADIYGNNAEAVTLSGSIKIGDLMVDGEKLAVGELDGAQIGISSTYNYAFAGSAVTEAQAACFTAVQEGKSVYLAGGNLMLVNNGTEVTVGDQTVPFDAAVYLVGEGGYIKLHQDIAANVTVQKNVMVDLNGCTISGDVYVVDGAVLSLFDNTTSDFSVAPENYGKITGELKLYDGGDLARSMNTPADFGHNYKYLTIQENDGSYSAHRIYLTVKSVVLTPANTGVSFKTVFKCNSVVAQYVDGYGVRLPKLDDFYKDEIVSGGDSNLRTTNIGNVLDAENMVAANAEQQITVSALIKLNDGIGGDFASAQVSRSLKDVVAYANANFDSLSRAQKLALQKMYETFLPVMENWGDEVVGNIK